MNIPRCRECGQNKSNFKIYFSLTRTQLVHLPLVHNEVFYRLSCCRYFLTISGLRSVLWWWFTAPTMFMDNVQTWMARGLGAPQTTNALRGAESIKSPCNFNTSRIRFMSCTPILQSWRSAESAQLWVQISDTTTPHITAGTLEDFQL